MQGLGSWEDKRKSYQRSFLLSDLKIQKNNLDTLFFLLRSGCEALGNDTSDHIRTDSAENEHFRSFSDVSNTCKIVALAEANFSISTYIPCTYIQKHHVTSS